VEIRAFCDSEIPGYLEIMRYSFRDWTDAPSKEEDPAWHPAEETLGLFQEGVMTSGMIIRRFAQIVRGERKPMGGVAGVATLPEWRGRGHVRTLFRDAFRRMCDSGRPVTMLHPFRESFYERLGYVAASAELWLAAPVEALAHYLPRSSGDGLSLSRFTGSEGLDRFLSAVGGRTGLPSGYVLRDDASPAFWTRRFKDSVYVFVGSSEDIRAAAAYKTLLRTKTPELAIRDWYWTDPEARDILFGYLASHRDQVTLLRFPVHPDAPFHQWFRDTMTQFQLRIDEKPWMVRVVDVAGALDGILSQATDELVVGVRDDQCDWNNDSFRLRVSEGRLRVTAASEEPDVELDIRGLSALLYGTLDAAELLHRGWMRGGGAGRLDAFFPRTSFYNPTYF
jgi:predicted acetyltransferase